MQQQRDVGRDNNQSPRDLLHNFARLHVLRRTFAWAPVLWFPTALALVAAGWSVSGFAVGLSGIVFAALLRGLLRLAKCPRCGGPYYRVKNTRLDRPQGCLRAGGLPYGLDCKE